MDGRRGHRHKTRDGLRADEGLAKRLPANLNPSPQHPPSLMLSVGVSRRDPRLWEEHWGSPQPLHVKLGHLKMANFQPVVSSRRRFPWNCLRKGNENWRVECEFQCEIRMPSANFSAKSTCRVRLSVRNPILRCPPLRCPPLGPLKHGALRGVPRGSPRGCRETSEMCILRPMLHFKRSTNALSETFSETLSETPKPLECAPVARQAPTKSKTRFWRRNYYENNSKIPKFCFCNRN